MAAISAKKVLEQAKHAELEGKLREASALYAKLALHLRKHGRFSDARLLLKKAIALFPSSARLHLHLALCEIGAGNESAAMEAVRSFAEAAYRKERLALYISHVEEELGAYPALRQVWYETALQWDRTFGGFFIGLANAQIAQKKWQAAKDTLVSALKTKTQDEKVCELLRMVFEACGQQRAIAIVDRFLRGKLPREDLILQISGEKLSDAKAPSTVTASSSLPEVSDLSSLIRNLERNLGIGLEEKYDTVVPLLREFRQKAETIIGSDSEMRRDLALAYFEMGLYREAEEEINRIANHDPRYLEAQCLKAEVLSAQGSELSALEVLAAILRDERTQGEIRHCALYGLARTYLRLNDIQKALEHITLLEREAPGYRDVHRLRLKLQDGNQGN